MNHRDVEQFTFFNEIHFFLYGSGKKPINRQRKGGKFHLDIVSCNVKFSSFQIEWACTLYQYVERLHLHKVLKI